MLLRQLINFPWLVQAFYLTLIATKANSTDLFPYYDLNAREKVLRNPCGETV